jgi:predicted ABC-type ATPase
MQKIATVFGTTGVGKSQLGVELCKALGGQIINADAMQVRIKKYNLTVLELTDLIILCRFTAVSISLQTRCLYMNDKAFVTI